MYVGVVLFAILGLGIFQRALRLEEWDPEYLIVAGDEADGTRRFEGEIEDNAQICAGRGEQIVCARPGSSLAVRRRLTAVAEQSQRLDLYATILSATPRQWGPTRILTFSADRFRRNVTLGQEGTALVVRMRTPIMGPNGYDWQIWIPEAIRPGERQSIHVSFDHGSLETILESGDETRTIRHRFDALSSGLLLNPPREVTPLQVAWTRLLGMLILVIPMGLLLLAIIPRRPHSGAT